MKKQMYVVAMLAGLMVSGVSRADDINGINIDFSNVGSAGYAADSTGYGYVDHNYQIGVTEVTIAQFIASGATDGTPGGEEDRWSGVGQDAPAARITWHEAARFCNFLTSSNVNLGAYSMSGGLVTGVDRGAAVATYGTVYVMPTEDEWYKAAYFTGSGYSDYANGLATPPSQGAGGAMYSSNTVWIAGSGAVEQNGTFDLMGNVWEWTESAFDGTLDDQGGAALNENIALRGGNYFNDSSLFPSSQRYEGVPTEYWQTFGMRVAAIPEPGTISLMSLSTLSLFITRTVRRRKRIGSSLVPVRREPLCDTFSAEREWRGHYDVDSEPDYLAEMGIAVKRLLQPAWESAAHSYRTLDKAFWNRMVARHELRVERRRSFTKAVKKKALDGFDAFLALIIR
jgi:formylglycine-generating enzyme